MPGALLHLRDVPVVGPSGEHAVAAVGVERMWAVMIMERVLRGMPWTGVLLAGGEADR